MMGGAARGFFAKSAFSPAPATTISGGALDVDGLKHPHPTQICLVARLCIFQARKSQLTFSSQKAAIS
jgi:hypothetical protein